MKRDVRYLDLPTDLWDAIEDAAAAAGRSVDMDVRLRLEAAIKADAQQQPTYCSITGHRMRTPARPVAGQAAMPAAALPEAERWEADGPSIFLAGTPFCIARVFGPPSVMGREERDGQAVAQQAQAFARIMALAPAMVAELRAAAATFRDYERHHLAKPDPEKAQRNAVMAGRIEGVLAQAQGDAPAEVAA